MARILVTGGAGFIGSHLVDSLIRQRHQVVILDNFSTGKRENVNPRAAVIVGDVRNAPLLRRALIDVDAVFHLAAVASVQKSTEDWLGTHETNSAGTVAVFNAARCAKNGMPIPVVYASSAAVYGAREGVLTETDPTVPLTSYGADKLGNEIHAKAAGEVHSLPTCGFRFFNVYGPRQDPASPYSGVISIFSDRIAAGETITVFGDGEQTRDFIHVSDIVRFLIAGLERASIDAPVFNACTGRPTSIKDLIATLSALTGLRPTVAMKDARIGDIRHSLGDPTKAEKKLGITAEFGLRAGLATLVRPKSRKAAA